ncbi:MAG: PepSY-associated TM helix domain-containing protein [Ilumatobacteraceae bacterium]
MAALFDRELETEPVTDGRNPSASKRRKQVTSRWVRWVHVDTSMISLLVVLFFGITGITLNHPDWTFGDSTSIDATPTT